ncbi:unnamed protein product [Rotaria magnacalcarata]|uniref:Protein kinase C n=4 Tax=Rotaria magnacalcarata TaxID=392030 RepID=A0A815SG44_9BILA|nr:unnamed protein product [Rotaria magnacalcarata]CAF1630600.1 unnamed protein product [Rotaria magnacalcarata]CAF2014014.1 unnamed protein product [Rotaria magnacalcarata]CAF3777880.1 unnamed protein product [Rotaria magnacalcarata]CAF3854289.1 unnamed protein product [Rotaria magnacalcarata]
MEARQASQELIFICLKFGITYQSIQVDKANPNILSELHKQAVEIVSKSIGSLEVNNHRHDIKLFLISPDHQPPNLKLITRSTDITPTCFIEIIIWRPGQETVIPPRDHMLVEYSYRKPTYCSSCDYFMWGLIKQGKRCKTCRRNYHHQCAEHLPADCPGSSTRRSSSVSRTSSSSTLSSMSQAQVYTDQDLISVSQSSSKRTKIGKFFNSTISKHSHSSNASVISTTLPGSTVSTSSKSTKGVLQNSNKNNDNKSASLNNADAPVTPSLSATHANKNGRSSLDQNVKANTRSSVTSQLYIKPNQRKDLKLTNVHEKDGVWLATGQFGRESRHSKRTEISYDKKKFRFTQKNENGVKHDFEIQASEIEGFRYQVSSNSVFNGSQFRDSISGAPSSQVVVYQKLACLLLDTINEAVQSSKDHRARSSFKMVRGTENDTKDFADLYDMNEKEILGMGRFGMVFGGTMRKNGVRVAIKKIQTTQCTQKDRENIEQEAAYLFQLNHPGILKFEGIFDFEQHILLVTERLDTDMLNYILSNVNPKSRLSEDVTRFLAFQLVAAIRYLHFKNIAHCDLKPDNVLINIFPDDVVHLKVGDFGYARTIHEHSLRYSKVGTAAYLPPEVSLDQWRRAKGYNKTVDMWAIGVIVFVSITGYFPFHEEMDIMPQLDNIPKLFQDEVFSNVTEELKDLLHCRLLVPDAGHRMHSAGVIYHDWFQKSRNLLELCRQLEECLEKKWLTLFFEEVESTASIPFATVEESDSS